MSGDTRAQSGLDRLVLFILVLVVGVAAVSFLLGLGGVDVRAPQNDTAATTETTETPPDPTRLIVLDATGQTDGFGDDTVGVVRVTVTRNGSGKSIDTGSLFATWHNGGYYTLVPAGTDSGNVDGSFAVSLRGPSGSETELAEVGDRATLTFDLGADDVDGAAEFGSELSAGEELTLQLTTESGETTTVTLTVPDNLGEKSRVDLQRG